MLWNEKTVLQQIPLEQVALLLHAHRRREVSMSIKVVLADNNQLLRKPITQRLSDDPRIQVVGEAENLSQLLDLVHSVKPDVILMDLHIASDGRYPVEIVAPKLRKTTGSIVAMSMWNDADTRELAQKLGAHALLDKFDLYDRLIPTILQSVTDPASAAL